MEKRPKLQYVIILLFILNLSPLIIGVEQVPCYFIFGASLYDNGNNNFLFTLARANFPPYGIDFPAGQTGRFSNGRNIADITAELLGFEKSIPSFASAIGQDILKGVNYASGSAGIRDETGLHLGFGISLNNQLINHQNIISRIERILGDKESASKYLRKCIYTVGMGTNDYIGNYFLPQFYPTSRLFTPEQYAIVLIQQYSQQLKALYNYGARKVALFGLTPLGCTPANIAIFGTNGSPCVDFINTAVQLFNTRLISLVDQLNNNFQDAKFIYVNSYDIMSSISSGFRVTNMPCCAVGGNNAFSICIPFLVPCANRGEHLWWDATHSSEAVNVLLAGRSYSAKFPSDTYPIDIGRLARL
ncbi:GDSL esterase/lipase [Melia azedarach]|uniref:GDSL esterase/lipase n=1 Tax=Melia azedarach TaxID=155640 RepID=A0ACC1Y7G2_MELAZ|nr:GDSL esterase/lipase [Melia azedarach]